MDVTRNSWNWKINGVCLRFLLYWRLCDDYVLIGVLKGVIIVRMSTANNDYFTVSGNRKCFLKIKSAEVLPSRAVTVKRNISLNLNKKKKKVRKEISLVSVSLI